MDTGSSSRTIVIGSKAVVVQNNSLPTTSSSSSPPELKGTILVSLLYNSSHRVLQVQFCDGSTGSHRGTVPLDALISEDLAENAAATTTTETPINDQTIQRLKKALMINSKGQSKRDQDHSNSRIPRMEIRLKDGDNVNTGRTFEVVVQTTLMNGMVKFLHREDMTNTTPGSDGVVEFCSTAGDELNEALRTIESLKNELQKLQRSEQDTAKDRLVLLENFNKLRLDCVQRHKKELSVLQEKHDVEIRTLKASIPDNIPFTKRRRKAPDEEDIEEDSPADFKFPFSEKDVHMLKDGASSTNHREDRKRVLDGSGTTNMKAVFDSANQYDKKRVEQQQPKSQSRDTTKKKRTSKVVSKEIKKETKSSRRDTSSSSSSFDDDVEEKESSSNPVFGKDRRAKYESSSDEDADGYKNKVVDGIVEKSHGKSNGTKTKTKRRTLQKKPDLDDKAPKENATVISTANETKGEDSDDSGMSFGDWEK